MVEPLRHQYELKIGKREHGSWDPESGNLIEYYKIVTVTSNGQSQEYRVGLSILKDEQRWAEFLQLAVEPWVRGTLQ